MAWITCSIKVCQALCGISKEGWKDILRVKELARYSSDLSLSVGAHMVQREKEVTPSNCPQFSIEAKPLFHE